MRENYKNNTNKEEALREWTEMVEHSWTWELLTEEEKRTFIADLNKCSKIIKGDYKSRWDLLNLIYIIYIDGIEKGMGNKLENRKENN